MRLKRRKKKWEGGRGIGRYTCAYTGEILINILARRNEITQIRKMKRSYNVGKIPSTVEEEQEEEKKKKKRRKKKTRGEKKG